MSMKGLESCSRAVEMPSQIMRRIMPQYIVAAFEKAVISD